MKIITILACILSFSTFVACNKVEGQGGTSTIKGKVLIVDLNGSGDTVQPPYYALDQDVYILYGDADETYDDDFATSYDGSYEFNNLTKGQYTVFAYSKCETCGGGVEVIKKTVEISSNKQVVEVVDLVIID